MCRTAVALSLLALILPSVSAESTYVPKRGMFCMVIEYFRSHPDDQTKFFECSIMGDKDLEEYRIPGRYLGRWEERDCPNKLAFAEGKQRCTKPSAVRRQPTSGFCQSQQPATVGSQCPWQASALQQDSTSNYFLQCAPQAPSASCGQWVRMPCTPGTQFNFNLQICSAAPTTPNPCGPQQAPVCGCNQQQQCPGYSSCQQNSCCQQTVQFPQPVPLPAQPYPQQPQPYPYPQPQQPFVQPRPYPIQPQQPTGQCPTGQAPSGACSGGFGCPQGSACYGGGCCQLSCPSGQQGTSFCQQGGGCPQQSSCYRPTSCCCQRQPPPQICPNGQPAVNLCASEVECAAGLECSNGGCCPLPFCPRGDRASARCIGGGACGGGGSACVGGLCCQVPSCPGGGFATRYCDGSPNSCSMGFECSNGGCCPLPSCPGGVVGTQRCTPFGCCCPTGQLCQNGVCCSPPTCPGGGPATGICQSDAQCGPGLTCEGGGCCPLPLCPGGQRSSRQCTAGSQCFPGQGCFGGVCCALPLCPGGQRGQQQCATSNECTTGQACDDGVCCPLPFCIRTGVFAVQVCGPGGSCPTGFVCEGRGCCEEPLPICPAGGRATQRCSLGSECPEGYGCTNDGGCCLLSLQPRCPVQQQPVCQCAPNNQCPQYSACNSGVCCAGSQSPLGGVIPGGQCQQSNQCNGYSAGCAACSNNYCACTGSAWSNGGTCQLGNGLQAAQTAYNPSAYRNQPRMLRRKPVEGDDSMIVEEERKPLWYNVGTTRHCPMEIAGEVAQPNNTCLPNEICIEGICTLKLWPGESGCKTDMECRARCQRTYCHTDKADDKGIGQCLCKDGFLLFGHCFTICPEGTVEDSSLGKCIVENEDEFWTDDERQDRMKHLLELNSCE